MQVIVTILDIRRYSRPNEFYTISLDYCVARSRLTDTMAMVVALLRQSLLTALGAVRGSGQIGVSWTMFCDASSDVAAT